MELLLMPLLNLSVSVIPAYSAYFASNYPHGANGRQRILQRLYNNNNTRFT